MTLIVTFIEDDQTEVTRYCMEHADDWLTIHATDKRLKFTTEYDEDKH